MHQWIRLPDSDAAGTTSADTTETQVGSGFRVPEWAKSLVAVHFHTTALALTTATNAPAEQIQGWFRIVNDENTIDPLNFPQPEAVCLTGAIGTHISPLAVTFPAYSRLTKNDTLRIYAAFDDTQTGAHTWQAFLLLSSNPAPYQMHAQKSALITCSATANAASATTTIETVAGKTSGIIGLWGTLIDMPTAAQTTSGYAVVSSRAAGWLEQRLPLPVMGSGLSTQITPFLQPNVMILPELMPQISGALTLPWPNEFPINVAETFYVKTFMDGTNTVTPISRVGLMWRE